MSSSIQSSLPAPALQASKAALNAALSDIESSDLGEVQEIEVDMALQAETLKTVFNDPKNFNVKVRVFPRLSSFSLSFGREDPCCLSRSSIWWLIFCFVVRRVFSIRFILHGRCGLIHPRRKVATYRRHP